MTITVPSTKPGTVLDQRTMRVPLYKVLLHNDERNTMEHVVKALKHVFRFSKPVCERIMMEAHLNGVALCTIEPLEQAELHRDQLQSFSLAATIEPD
jgi:ATP-dependent Clp protease adaptor protein ClpS